jgi:hypothetical protein
VSKDPRYNDKSPHTSDEQKGAPAPERPQNTDEEAGMSNQEGRGPSQAEGEREGADDGN